MLGSGVRLLFVVGSGLTRFTDDNVGELHEHWYVVCEGEGGGVVAQLLG